MTLIRHDASGRIDAYGTEVPEVDGMTVTRVNDLPTDFTASPAGKYRVEGGKVTAVDGWLPPELAADPLADVKARQQLAAAVADAVEQVTASAAQAVEQAIAASPVALTEDQAAAVVRDLAAVTVRETMDAYVNDLTVLAAAGIVPPAS